MKRKCLGWLFILGIFQSQKDKQKAAFRATGVGKIKKAKTPTEWSDFSIYSGQKICSERFRIEQQKVSILLEKMPCI